MTKRDKDTCMMRVNVKDEIQEKIKVSKGKGKKKIVQELINSALNKTELSSWSYLTEEIGFKRTSFSYDFTFLGLTFVFGNEEKYKHTIKIRLSRITKIAVSDNPMTALKELQNSILFIKQFARELSGESELPSQTEEELNSLLLVNTEFLHRNISIYNELTNTEEIVFSILPNFSLEFYFPIRDFSIVLIENDMFNLGIINDGYSEILEKSFYFGARSRKTYINLYADESDYYNAEFLKKHLNNIDMRAILFEESNKKVRLFEELDYLVNATSYFKKYNTFPEYLLKSLELRFIRIIEDAIILRDNEGFFLCYNPSAELLTEKTEIEIFLSKYISE